MFYAGGPLRNFYKKISFKLLASVLCEHTGQVAVLCVRPKQHKKGIESRAYKYIYMYEYTDLVVEVALFFLACTSRVAFSLRLQRIVAERRKPKSMGNVWNYEKKFCICFVDDTRFECCWFDHTDESTEHTNSLTANSNDMLNISSRQKLLFKIALGFSMAEVKALRRWLDSHVVRGAAKPVIP